MPDERKQLESEIEQKNRKRDDLKREQNQTEWNLEDLKNQIRTLDSVIDNDRRKIDEMEREEKFTKERERLEEIKKRALAILISEFFISTGVVIEYNHVNE